MRRIIATLTMTALWAAMLPTTACSGATVAQDIVNWTPTIVSTAQTVAITVGSLDPTDAATITVSVTGFTAAANLLSDQAKAYLSNPSTSNLQVLQAQVLAFEQNVNLSLLQAARITNTVSQQRVMGVIQLLATALTAVMALVIQIKGNTLSQVAIAPVKVSQVAPLMNQSSTVAEVAAHYGESSHAAEIQIAVANQELAAVGL